MRTTRSVFAVMVPLVLGAMLGIGISVRAQPVDSDGDGTPDAMDICSLHPGAPVPCGLDTDQDGYGNLCDGDFNNDGATNYSDVELWLQYLGLGFDPDGRGFDMNCDGAGNNDDVFFQIQLNQGFPGPSGLSCAGTVPCP